MFGLFEKIKTEEYLELKKDLEHLRIMFEALKLDVEIYRNKLRVKNKLVEEEKDKDLNNSVFLSPNGVPIKT